MYKTNLWLPGIRGWGRDKLEDIGTDAYILLYIK